MAQNSLPPLQGIKVGLTLGHVFAGIKWAFSIVGVLGTAAAPFVIGWVQTTVHTTDTIYSTAVSQADDAFRKGVANNSKLSTLEAALYRELVELEGATYCGKQTREAKAVCANAADKLFDNELEMPDTSPRAAAARAIQKLRPPIRME